MPSTPKSNNTRFTSKQPEKPHLPLPPHDDQETQTIYTLSSEPVIQRMQCELVLLQETITKQGKRILSLERKLGHLDSNIVVLESQLALVSHVTDVLQEKLDDQEQYSLHKNETEASLTNSIIDIIKSDLQLPYVTVNDVDKCR